MAVMIVLLRVGLTCSEATLINSINRRVQKTLTTSRKLFSKFTFQSNAMNLKNVSYNIRNISIYIYIHKRFHECPNALVSCCIRVVIARVPIFQVLLSQYWERLVLERCSRTLYAWKVTVSHIFSTMVVVRIPGTIKENYSTVRRFLRLVA